MAIGNLLNQTITVQNPTAGRGKHGESGFGGSADVRARVQLTKKTIVTAEREREPIDAIIFVAAGASVEIGAKVTHNGVAYRAMSSSPVPGRDGTTHHFELMVQLWSFAA